MSTQAADSVVHVQVTIDATSGLPACAPNPVPVTAPNTLIVFDLATAGYKFPASGAVVVNTPGDDFPYACWRTDNRTASLYDAGDDNLAYAYTVSVVKTSTGETFSLDPVIDNKTH